MSSFVRDIAAPFQSEYISANVNIPECLLTNSSDEPEAIVDISSTTSVKDIDYIEYNAIEPVDDLKKEKYIGPHPESNWVILGQLIAGAFPGDKNIEKTEENLLAILQTGVTCFVCLQTEYNPDATEESVQSEKDIRPYMNDLTRMFAGNAVVPAVAEAMTHLQITLEDLEFIHVPIKDCGVTNDSIVQSLVEKLYEKIVQGKILYVHCWGGHGRAGTVICILLAKLYDMSAYEAMRYNNVVHMFRKSPVPIGSPQTGQQMDQVTRIVAAMETIV
jgi:hypothetical protein